MLLLVVLFVPFGFDHPSPWGLDFGHLLIVLALCALALLGGLIAASSRKKWSLLQVVAPIVMFVLGVFGVISL